MSKSASFFILKQQGSSLKAETTIFFGFSPSNFTKKVANPDLMGKQEEIISLSIWIVCVTVLKCWSVNGRHLYKMGTQKRKFKTTIQELFFLG